MLDGILDPAQLLAAVRDLARTRRIIGPVAHAAPRSKPPVRHFYEVVTRPEQLDLLFDYCVYSPKRFLFPPQETLFRFQRDRHAFVATPLIDRTPQALVGVHPCDINAIRTLDSVFTRDYADEHYLARRENTFIVGVDCPKPCTSGVFCADMHGNVIQSGFDVMLYPLERDSGRFRYGVVFGSAAGRAWLAEPAAAHCCRPASAADERALQAYAHARDALFVRQIDTPAEKLPALMQRSYDSLLWEATARRCYSCASCNLVCPTCYCFNMLDTNDLPTDSGSRCREWDGCQLREFALVAGGHNFRTHAASRLRHRLMRKAVWTHERSGRLGCVGCARCDRACTAHINSVDIYNQLAEEV